MEWFCTGKKESDPIMKRNILFIFMILIIIPAVGWCQTQTPFTVAQLSGQSQDDETDTDIGQTPEEIMGGPVPGKAFLLSFLVPGTGEWYAGSSKMAKIFFGTEVTLWAAYIAFKTYENWTVDDYALFATSHAGVDPTDKEHDYYVNVENFNSLREYNDAKLRQRNPALLYPETETYNWQWDSDSNRKKFESMRISADDAKSRALLVIGGIVINHVISGVDAVRVARKEQKRSQLSCNIRGLPEGGMQVSMQLRF